jgi:biotin carboxyl carrier protein
MQIKAQCDCIVISIFYKDGDTVSGGAEILMVEVMKMMISYDTTGGGVIKYNCKVGDYVKNGQVLAEVSNE